MKRLRITVCRGPDCGRDSDEIESALRDVVATHEAGAQVEFDDWSCFGRCRDGPNIIVRELKDSGDVADETIGAGLVMVPSTGRSTMYNQMTPDRAVLLLQRLLDGLPLPIVHTPVTGSNDSND